MNKVTKKTYCANYYNELSLRWIHRYNTKQKFMGEHQNNLKKIHRLENILGDNVLSGNGMEFGFAAANGLWAINKLFPDTVMDGIDFNPRLKELIPIIKDTISNVSRLIIGDCANVPVKDNYYDFVTAMDFTEHLPKIKYNEFLYEVKRILKPGGIFVLYHSNARAPGHLRWLNYEYIRKSVCNKGYSEIKTWLFRNI